MWCFATWLKKALKEPSLKVRRWMTAIFHTNMKPWVQISCIHYKNPGPSWTHSPEPGGRAMSIGVACQKFLSSGGDTPPRAYVENNRGHFDVPHRYRSWYHAWTGEKRKRQSPACLAQASLQGPQVRWLHPRKCAVCKRTSWVVDC